MLKETTVPRPSSPLCVKDPLPISLYSVPGYTRPGSTMRVRDVQPGSLYSLMGLMCPGSVIFLQCNGSMTGSLCGVKKKKKKNGLGFVISSQCSGSKIQVVIQWPVPGPFFHFNKYTFWVSIRCNSRHTSRFSLLFTMYWIQDEYGGQSVSGVYCPGSVLSV